MAEGLREGPQLEEFGGRRRAVRFGECNLEASHPQEIGRLKPAGANFQAEHFADLPLSEANVALS